MHDARPNQRSHDEWLAELDLIGAVASREQLWRQWLNAPDMQTEDAQHLFTFLITSNN